MYGIALAAYSALWQLVLLVFHMYLVQHASGGLFFNSYLMGIKGRDPAVGTML